MKLLTTTLALVSFCLMGVIFRSDAPGTAADRNVQEFYNKLKGEWSGPYSVWLNPMEPPLNSEIAAQGRFVAQGSYFLLTYSWKAEDEEQEGVFLLGGEGETASSTWGDSWHMQPEPMVCEGELTEEGQKLVFLGSYGAGPGISDWGWRTEFTLQGEDAFLMEAYNITPEGLESLAVRAELTRK